MYAVYWQTYQDNTEVSLHGPFATEEEAAAWVEENVPLDTLDTVETWVLNAPEVKSGWNHGGAYDEEVEG